ncbi:concentrative nucleoside transporter, CNT family [Kytococcus aerolatus]|uniref:Concentrative nucleoside transporter, CNT family n=1 Tax=Kytococcus aerolatus TaxID=592308 RepID=A0A212U0C5_9MICO|nr:nucleoside transporter C-terminal domain-containing protein [Kytococcus aerolatus]SNC71610.1 concentrative nucleoside transporter, CNT family [Kytococcus aerolatus]
MSLLWSVGGMLALVLIAWLFSVDRSAVRWRTVAAALALQVGFGVITLFWGPGQRALEAVSRGVSAVIGSANAGIEFVFGPVLPEEGSVFAFQVLPVIIFFASLTAVLFHLGIMQKVVNLLGNGLGFLLGTGRYESVNAAANILVGQTEAPLVIKPYLRRLDESALFAVMVGGLATVAGSVLAGYALLGAKMEYLIAASFMAAPGALLMAKIMVPEGVSAPVRAGVGSAAAVAPGAGSTRAEDRLEAPEEVDPAEEPAVEDERADNVIEAAAQGAQDGLKLALTVGAMLLAFISLIELMNLLLGTVGGWFGQPELSFEQLLGWVFAPVMLLVGVPWAEAGSSGSFLGQKIVLNEFVAFANFTSTTEGMSERTQAITTFALTGFANLGSLGILLGGLGGLVPERRGDIARLGLRAILAATLANLMSAAIAGLLIG